MTGRIAGKVAVITGGASGIGLGIARRFVAEGGSVVLGDVNDAGLEMATKELGDASSGVHADVMDEDSVAALCAHAVEDPRTARHRRERGRSRCLLPCRRSRHRDVGHRDGSEPPRRDAVDEARSPSDGRRGERRLDHQPRVAQRDPAGGGHGPLLRDQGRGRHVHEVRGDGAGYRTASGPTRSVLASSIRHSPRS